jgi:WD40 repeat protein
MEKVKEFMGTDQKVFLLMGDSGAGKSTFNRELEFELWQSYKKKTGRIPLHINLPAIDKPEYDMIAKQLRRAEFTEPQILEMKRYRKFILICDGYDESQQTHNLYMSNRLNQEGEWDAQMVISCRTEYLGTDYRDRFQPGDRNQQPNPSLFQEAVITPFSLDQVQAYIQQYVALHQPLWQVEDYKQALEHIPSLKDLMKNPFLMTLSLEVLPRMVDPRQHLSKAHVTRVGLYDHFVEQWLERGKKRFGEKDLSPQARAAFENLSDEGFALNGIEYLKKLAVAIYKEQGGHPIVGYSLLIDGESWKAKFFAGKANQILREACPLTRNGNQHRFVHRSLLEYSLARAIFDPQEGRKTSALMPINARRGSVSSALSFEIEDSQEEASPTYEQEPDPNSPLVWRSFVNDHSLTHFLEERVQQEPVFKNQLLTYIEYSKKDKKWRKAAANAITILVRAGEEFIGADLKDIRIPGADLSYGVFDSAQLQNADLRRVSLRGVWLRQTDLSGSQMTGVRFGELPFLPEGMEIRSCVYSPNGKSVAVGLEDGNINVYSTSNWERTRTLSGHGDIVRRIAYSPTGDKIASASYDLTIRLWDADTGSQLHILIGHTDHIYCVAYSPQNDLIASASADKTVKLWDVTNGGCRKVLHGHTGAVRSVAYSPSGNHVVSCSIDYTIRLWDAKTGECIRTLPGHSDFVWDVAYSPHGDQIASASEDKTIRLWDVETGVTLHILQEHTNAVYVVDYSPNGDQFISGSLDTTLRLWDTQTGSCRQTLTGHQDTVYVAAFSPQGDQIASASADTTLRLWDVSAGSSHLVSRGHSSSVESIKYSLKGDLIASGSADNTIRLWETETGACRRVLSGHTDTVFGVAFSPKGDWIASGGGRDKSVRLWKVESGECLHILIGHTDWVNNVVFSPEGDVVASASDDLTIRLWNVVTGDRCRILNGHERGVQSVVYASNSKQIATGSQDSTLRLWDVGTGECCKVLRGHAHWVREVAYSPQGDQVASASSDKTVRLWDVQSGECRFILIGHTLSVWGVTYSGDGKLLASGSADRTVRLWDVSSGECRAVVKNFPCSICCVDWCASPDVNYLVTGCRDGSILQWQVTEEADQYHGQLQWSAANGILTVTGASIQGARGLTALNKQLLEQRGAIGEPEHLLREASKKMIAMASAVSKLKETSERTAENSPSAPGLSVEQQEQLEQLVESPLTTAQ